MAELNMSWEDKLKRANEMQEQRWKAIPHSAIYQ